MVKLQGVGGDGSGADGKYHCDYCKKDISSIIRIKCAQCTDFDLCIECFSVGVEVKPHEKTHAYRVMDNLSFPLFTQDWGADEELLLLEAIEIYGLGNWADVAEHVGTKNKQKCEQHYYNTYVPSKIPLPEQQLQQSEAQQLKPNPHLPIAGKGVFDVALIKDAFERASKQDTRNATAPVEVVQWMPFRGDFDVEYENDAELMLQDLEFFDGDSKQDADLKVRIMEIYCSKLDAREERKKFILDRGLLDWRKIQAQDRKRTREEREIHNKMKCFARFMSAEEHERFVQGLVTEKAIRKRIEELQDYRRNGITTLMEGEVYSAEKKRRTELSLSAKGKSSAQQIYSQERAKRIKLNLQGPDQSATGKGGAMKRKAAAPLDVAGMPGLELISLKEKELCEKLRLVPSQYLIIKDILTRECFKHGFLKRSTARSLVKVDVNKTSKIFDFFVEAGWVTENPAPHRVPVGPLLAK